MWTQLLKGLDTRSAFENRKFRTENKIVLIIKRIFMKIKERNQMLDKKCYSNPFTNFRKLGNAYQNEKTVTTKTTN